MLIRHYGDAYADDAEVAVVTTIQASSRHIAVCYSLQHAVDVASILRKKTC